MIHMERKYSKRASVKASICTHMRGHASTYVIAGHFFVGFASHVRCADGDESHDIEWM
jgi:hypothetical protein